MAAAVKVEVKVEEGALFGREQQLAVQGADGTAPAYYHGSSSHGAAALSAAAPHNLQVQSGGAGGEGSVDPAGGVEVVAGMAPPPGFAAGYGGAALPVLPLDVAPIAAVAPAPFKGPWTNEEDEMLRNMVAEHGDRKWAAIARTLPGRIGKQCRERWINHLHPDIKKDVWTEEEDMALIEAHKKSGNRWSAIARHIPGRSENSVKNHWNATKRSLTAKRRLRIRRNGDLLPVLLPGQQLSLLAEYIRSLCPDLQVDDGRDDADASPPMAAAADEYVQVQAQGEGSSNQQPGENAAAGMYLDQGPALPPAPAPVPVPMEGQLGQYRAAFAGGMPDDRYSYYLPPYGHMNMHYGLVQMAPEQQMVGGGGTALANHFHAAPAPFAVAEGMNNNNYLHQHQQFDGDLASNVAVQQMEFDDCESSTNYYGGDPAASSGGDPAASSGGGGDYHDQDEMEVAQMASREFSDHDQDDLTLDLTRFG